MYGTFVFEPEHDFPEDSGLPGYRMLFSVLQGYRRAFTNCKPWIEGLSEFGVECVQVCP